MDWASAVTAIAAVIAAVGAVGALLAASLQLHQERLAREVDYYRKLTPFLSFAVSPAAVFAAGFGGAGPGVAVKSNPSIDVYADGGGYAFMVLAKVDQTDSSTGQNMTLPGQNVIRYLREGSPERIGFGAQMGDGLRGNLVLTFTDSFGIFHTAKQAMKVEDQTLLGTDAIRWACGPDCRVHMMRPTRPPGLLTRFAQWVRLY
jgi:hypothetical protein